MKSLYSVMLLTLLFAMSHAQIPTNGLVAYYPFNGNANDESGNGNSCYVSNAVLTANRSSQPNSAFYFDGTAMIKSNSAFMDIGWQGYTISGWFKPGDMSKENQTMLNTDPHVGIGISYNTYASPGYIDYGLNSNPAMNPNGWDMTCYKHGVFNQYNSATWYHFVFVKSGLTYRLYINGVLDDTYNATIAPISYLCKVRFGTHEQIPYAGGYLIGSLDDIRIYSRDLSLAEIQLLYNEVLNPNGALYHEDFETYVTGSYPSSGGWVNATNGPTDISESFAQSPVKSLRVQASNWQGGYVRIPAFPEITEFEVWVRTPHAPVTNSDNIIACGIRYYFAVNFHLQNGSVFLSDYYGDVGTIGQCAPDTWYKLRVVYYSEARQVSCWLNDVQLCSHVSIRPFEAPDLDWNYYGSELESAAYLDDLEIRSINICDPAIFSDDFEQYETGTYPAIGNWINHSVFGTAEIASNNSHSPSNSLKLAPANWHSGYVSIPVFPAHTKFEAWIKTPQTSPNSPGQYIACGYRYHFAINFMLETNEVVVSDYYGTPITIGQCYGDTWYKVAVVYDKRVNKLSCWINDVLLASSISILPYSVPQLDWNYYAGNLAYDAFIDDVRLWDMEACELTCPPNIVFANDQSSCGAIVTFNSEDMYFGGEIAFIPPSGSFIPVGTTTIQVYAEPNLSCSFNVTVEDRSAPAINMPDVSQVADPGQCTAQVHFNSVVTDNCSGVTLLCDPPSGSIFQKGTSAVTCTAVDASNNVTVSSFNVTVIDSEAPEITLTSPVSLWPANLGYANIAVSGMINSVSDNCDNLSINDVFIASVACDEPEIGSGTGNLPNDIVIAGDCRSVQLRRERSGNGNGRVYSVHLRLTDLSGNIESAVYTVSVPRNPNLPVTEDTQEYVVPSVCGNPKQIATDIAPHGYALPQNFPNPFNPTTTIAFTLPDAGRVLLRVYDSFGRLVRTLVESERPAGTHSAVFDAASLPSGTYFCRLEVNGRTLHQTMSLVK